jgi:hypothetical protein
MHAASHFILYRVEIGGILFLTSYSIIGYYICRHIDSIIIVIRQAIICYNLLVLSQAHLPSLVHRLTEKGMAISELKTQHRMQPQIAKLIISTLCPGLESHTSVSSMCKVKGVNHNMFFISHEHLADKVHACIMGWLHTPSVIQIISTIVISKKPKYELHATKSMFK